MRTAEQTLTAARAGDQQAFQHLVAPHQRAIHLHCYRMLGSFHDAEDATQDTLLLAWRGLPGYRAEAPLRHWLMRIATTTCLKSIRGRDRRPVDPVDIAHLEPYPDRLLDQLTDTDTDPARVAERRESVALAFITTLQLLPATPRAALILRDVLCWSAAEVADLLDTTVPAVNSALQRARATLAKTHPHTQAAPAADEKHLLDRFLHAWQACDITALATLLHQDVTLTMPPQAIRIDGRAAVAEFFATVPADGRLDTIRLRPTRANGHPALAAYLPDDQQPCRGYGIMVLTVTDRQITTITGFPDPTLFPIFDLPPHG